MNNILEFFELTFSNSQPLWVRLWVAWMILINTMSIFFINKKMGKIIFIVWNLNAATMIGIFSFNGYNRLLGLSHIIWWTPLAIFMFKERFKQIHSKFYHIWFKGLFVTIVLSLILDYIDFVRYIL